MSRIGVIGGSGFIGTRLCARLAAHGQGFENLDKAQSASFPDHTVIADVRDPESLERMAPDCRSIVNLAAEHRDDVRPIALYEEVNVGGARNVCALARARGIGRIVFTSSVAVYGFAPIGTDETGRIAPFNHYGRTKYAAEEVYRAWQAEDPEVRSLTILRPTVVFGERNRGNVYNLMRQMASGRFVMVGPGTNRKSMAYVENVAAFLEHALTLGPGVHLCNYIDKPDFDMNTLVTMVNAELGRAGGVGPRLPVWLAYAGGTALDLIARATNRTFPISAVRVKKFAANSVYGTRTDLFGFVPPVSLLDGLTRTVAFEFKDGARDGPVFYSE